MHEQNASTAIVLLTALALYVNPYVAIGASFGCVFFLQYPSVLSLGRRIALAFFSWGLGYATGVFWYGQGPPWVPEGLLPALAAAALGSAVFTAMAAMVEKDGKLPDWLEAVIKLFPWRR
jgi:hypothetical protein